MKMFLAKQPCRTPAEEASTNHRFLRCVGVGHYKFHKANCLPAGSDACFVPSGKQAQYRTRIRNKPPAGATRRLEEFDCVLFPSRRRISLNGVLPDPACTNAPVIILTIL